MYSNKLKLNAEKTDVLPVASTSHLSSVGRDNVDIGGKRIQFRSSVRNLGVHLDQTLSMQQHINSVCCAAYLELRRIASIRPYLTQSATAQLVSSAITSQLDYCNSILAGLPLKQISHLQRVQNNAAKLVLRKSKYDHVTPLLQELHWLPIKFWLQYKIATFVYCFFDSCLPGYLSQTMCIWTNMKPLLIVWKAPQSPKAQHQNVRRAFLQLSCTFCLELSAIRSQKFFYPSAVQIQTQNTLVHDSFLPVGSLQSSAPACPPSYLPFPPPPNPYPPNECASRVF